MENNKSLPIEVYRLQGSLQDFLFHGLGGLSISIFLLPIFWSRVIKYNFTLFGSITLLCLALTVVMGCFLLLYSIKKICTSLVLSQDAIVQKNRLTGSLKKVMLDDIVAFNYFSPLRSSMTTLCLKTKDDKVRSFFFSERELKDIFLDQMKTRGISQQEFNSLTFLRLD